MSDPLFQTLVLERALIGNTSLLIPQFKRHTFFFQCVTEIVTKVMQPELGVPFRPHISDDIELNENNNGQGNSRIVVEVIRMCWSEDPADRPTVKAVIRKMNKYNPYK